MAEDESWDVHLLVFMLHHRDAFAVVPDGDGVRLAGNTEQEVDGFLAHQALSLVI